MAPVIIGYLDDGGLIQRQAELARAERYGVLAAVEAARDLAEKERFAARIAAALELRDPLAEIRCYADGSVTAWVGA